jgi:hypothetical protein
LSRGTPVAGLIVLGSLFHFKAVEGSALATNLNLREEGSHLAVEPVLAHAEEVGRIAEADEAGKEGSAAVARCASFVKRFGLFGGIHRRDRELFAKIRR